MKNIDFSDEDLKILMQEINRFIHNDRNKILLEKCINERTVCGCIKEYLDDKFNDLYYSVDLEYNKRLISGHGELLKKMYCIEPINLNIVCDYIDNIDVKVKKYFDKLKSDDKNKYKKTFVPDIIVHKRGNDYDNLLLIEVKKSSNKFKKNDLIKLAAIKGYGGLKYSYYVYFEYGTKIEKSKIYYLNQEIDDYTFKKIEII